MLSSHQENYIFSARVLWSEWKLSVLDFFCVTLKLLSRGLHCVYFLLGGEEGKVGRVKIILILVRFFSVLHWEDFLLGYIEISSRKGRRGLWRSENDPYPRQIFSGLHWESGGEVMTEWRQVHCFASHTALCVSCSAMHCVLRCALCIVLHCTVHCALWSD